MNTWENHNVIPKILHPNWKYNRKYRGGKKSLFFHLWMSKWTFQLSLKLIEKVDNSVVLLHTKIARPCGTFLFCPFAHVSDFEHSPRGWKQWIFSWLPPPWYMNMRLVFSLSVSGKGGGSLASLHTSMKEPRSKSTCLRGGHNREGHLENQTQRWVPFHPARSFTPTWQCPPRRNHDPDFTDKET